LAAAALARVQEPATGRVRVEDYLTCLAATTGEAAMLATHVFDLETSDIPPGSPVFGDQINHLLSGDTTDLDKVPPTSVIGVLMAELVPDVFAASAFDTLEAIYRRVADHVGSNEWGHVWTSVPPDNQPTVLPIQVAFDLRPAVDAALAKSGLKPDLRHVPCTLALAIALKQVRGAIDMNVAMMLSLDVIFGVAKMMPMSRRAFAAAQSGQGDPGAQ